MPTQILANDIVTSATNGVGQKGDIAVVGGTPALSNIGPVQTATTPSNQADGRMWFSTNNLMFQGVAATQIVTFGGTVFSTTTASNTVTNSLAETTLNQNNTFPANLFTVGRTIRIVMGGRVTTNGTDTLSVRIYLGTNVVVSTSFTPAGATGKAWAMDVTMVCGATGVSGTFSGVGYVNLNGAAFPLDSTAAATVDTTASALLKVTMQWSTATAAESINSNVVAVTLS